MKKITRLDSNDFLEYIVDQIDLILEGEYVNYQHTHSRIHYSPETGKIKVEPICKNQDGAVFGLNMIGYGQIPVEWNQFLPEMLLNSPNWLDI